MNFINGAQMMLQRPDQRRVESVTVDLDGVEAGIDTNYDLEQCLNIS